MNNPLLIGLDADYDPAQEPVHHMIHLVAYDICDPRRLRHAAKLCEDYGVRVEKSVFECDLEDGVFASFWEALQGEIDPGEDSLVAYRLCKTCVGKTLSAGALTRPEKPLAYIF